MEKQETSSDASAHTPDTSKVEKKAQRDGKNPERETDSSLTASDSTSINPKEREPVDPRMPNMPPA